MQREVVWTPWDSIGMEHLVLGIVDEGSIEIEVESTVLGVEDDRPFTLRYRIACDRNWIVRRLTVEAPLGWARVELLSDGRGGWFSDDKPLSELDGCIDVDIMATPFTNTLPIRRLQLQPDESREIDVVYVATPSLEVSRLTQRYTRLDTNGQYRYESLRDGQTVFSADIKVDEDGLVVEYPGLFRRVPLSQATWP
jgi:uncharacterized protein